jgi:hypothetical protein
MSDQNLRSERAENITRRAPVPGNAEPLCFVIMPFGGLFDEYYREVIAPAVSAAGLSPLRSDEVRSHQRPIADEIRRLVQRASVCVGDVTGKSPNVFYELGLAHGLDRPVVLLAQSREDVPVELNDRRILWYRPETVAWAKHLGEELRESLVETLADAEPDHDQASPQVAHRGEPHERRPAPSLESGETLLRDLLADGISHGVISELLIEEGLPPSWVRLRIGRLSRPGW